MIEDDTQPYRPNLYGGSLALDFANTASGRETGPFWERLTAEKKLADWALAAGLIDDREHQELLRSPTMEDPVRAEAFELREAIHAVAASLSRGEEPNEATLQVLERYGIAAMEHSSLCITSLGQLDWRPPPVRNEVKHIEHHVALSALRTYLLEDHRRVRCCPGKGCGFVFIDRSKNGTRIWCDMAVCGNRAKAEKNRKRTKSGA